jgi:hypothetical protein
VYLMALLLAAAQTVLAAQREIITITDPAGDDSGSGTLIYPQRDDYQSGDLDLQRLSVSHDGEGFWFEAEFKNPIRNPALATTGVGPESLAEFARKGFYTFNIDVYIDTDRVKGSGNQFTLPGRNARIDPAYAWEKVVVLTPRPEFIRGKLLDVLEKQFPDRPAGEAEISMDQAMYFASRVRVRGKTVAFFVPDRFLGGSAGNDWAITAFVTGAKIINEAGISLLGSTKTPLEELDLGVMQPTTGRPRHTFGYSGRIKPLPIVDMLSPNGGQQAGQLAANAELTGVSWGPHAADDMAAMAAAQPAASPAKAIAPAATPAARKGWFSRSWDAVTGWFGDDETAAGVAAGSTAAVQPVTAAPIGEMLDPARPKAAAAVDAAPAGAAAAPSFSQRLKTLQQLYDDKLISEDEYKQQRQRILNQL